MRPLEEFGLARLREATTIPTVLHHNYYLWAADLQDDIPAELGIRLPGPNEPRPIERALAIWEKHRTRSRTEPEEQADRDLMWARVARNDICKVMPRLKGMYWSEDERDLFGLWRDDLEIPPEPATGKERYEIEQQYARIMGAFEKAKEIPYFERVNLILTRRIERLEARVAKLETEQ